MTRSGEISGRAWIRAVSFDLDDTLFDFQARMRESAARVIEALVRQHPTAAGRATVELLHELWSEAGAEAQAEGRAVDWPLVRQRSIERLTRACDCGDAGLVEQLTALYFRHRHAPSPPFSDAADAACQLAARLPLGVITNANTRIEQLGLAGHFRVVLAPGTTEHRKPDPRIFLQAAAALGCAPQELLHVGDNWELDVVGALQAGCQAAWYCRAPGAYPPGDGVEVAEWRPESSGRAPRSYLVIRDHRCLVPWVFARCGEPSAQRG